MLRAFRGGFISIIEYFFPKHHTNLTIASDANKDAFQHSYNLRERKPVNYAEPEEEEGSVESTVSAPLYKVEPSIVERDVVGLVPEAEAEVEAVAEAETKEKED